MIPRKIGEEHQQEETKATKAPVDQSEKDINSLLAGLSAPREKVATADRLDDMYSAEDAAESALNEPVNEVPEFTGDAFLEEAEAIAGAIDSMVGVIGMMATGKDMERYQRFYQKPPPNHYVKAWARVLEKYQMVMGPEWLLLGIITTLYTPSARQIYVDGKEVSNAKN